MEQVHYFSGGAGCLAAPLAQADSKMNKQDCRAPLSMLENPFFGSILWDLGSCLGLWEHFDSADAFIAGSRGASQLGGIF